MRVVISFDEMKPHWAIQNGFDKEAARLGLRDVVVSGDFDAKIACIYGTVDDFEKLETALRSSSLRDGSLCRVMDGDRK